MMTRLLQGSTLAVSILLSAATLPASAQSVPNAMMQEVLVKASLLTFNDANVTGNYSVLHAKLSKPFRDQFSPEKLKETFKGFGEQNIDFDVIAAKPMISEGEPKVDDNGVMRLIGHFETTPKQVKYRLSFIRSDGEWKMSGIKVDVD